MRKRNLFPLLILLLCLAGCRAEPENKFFELGDRVSTEFFRYEIENVATYNNYHGLRATDNCRIVVIDLLIENTEHYPLPMGRFDFRLQWGAGEEDFVYPQTWYYQEQFPNHYDIPEQGESRGQLIFQVPLEHQELTLAYLEVFENDAQGDAYFIYFSVDD